MRGNEDEELHEAPVYLHLAWRWSLAGVPVSALACGLAPAGIYGAAALVSQHASQHAPRTIVFLLMSLLAVFWQAPELLLERTSGHLRAEAKWSAAATLGLLLFTWVIHPLPSWPALPLVGAGVAGVFALLVGQDGLRVASLVRFLYSASVLSPTVRSLARRKPR